MRHFLILMILAFFGLSACAATTPSVDGVYLVRHAEKTKDKKDPALTPAGQQRAQDLAARLKDVTLTKIYSSDYTRTRDTAAPVAAAQGLEVMLYDPRDLQGFAETLSQEKGHILIVGHSNTTPPLVALLGGEAGEPINEATEYDRFYVLSKTGNAAITVMERYGQASGKPAE